MSNKLVVGIDLGTTNSCVAVYRNNNVEIIENKSTGYRVTPSVVSFSNEGLLVGKPSRITENTVLEAKRLIGRKFDDPHVQSDMKKWPFKVVDDSGKPKIRVTHKGKEETFSPEQIAAKVLAKLKECASLGLNQSVDKAVIAVPAYFNEAQRQATEEAGKMAGLDVLRIINEPTAAALAYGYDKSIYKKSQLLIFDLGGGTFDVSIMETQNGQFNVLAIGGDSHLGGADFDNNLVNYFIGVYQNKYKKDISQDKKALNRLRVECEAGKRALTEAKEVTIEIESFFKGEDFCETITRSVFEELNKELFQKTIDVVRTTLASAKLKTGAYYYIDHGSRLWVYF